MSQNFLLTGLRIRGRWILFMMLALLFCTCIDDYAPLIKGYKSLLVVEGLVTDENTPYSVRLSRSTRVQDSISKPVTGARLYITDETGAETSLAECGNGVYKTDSTNFRGTVGKTYVLHISTPDGNEYVSDPATMRPVEKIDSIFYRKEQEVTDNGKETLDGLRIYVNSKGNNNNYLRWGYEETWKFKVPSQKQFDYHEEDSSFTQVKSFHDFCWKNNKSSEVFIKSVNPGQPSGIEGEPLNFIASTKSDRLLVEYSILVKQYSISQDEYQFWDAMKKINNSGDDIFASQPFPVISNIHNIKDATEIVPGYFQVSAMTTKRLFISYNSICNLGLPVYNYTCKVIEMSPRDVPNGRGPALTWNDIYEIYCVTGKWVLVRPVYQPEGVINKKNLSKMVFAQPECAKCEVTGNPVKPDFWIDLN